MDAHVTRTFIGNTVTGNVDVFLAGTDTPANLDLFIGGNLGSHENSEYTVFDNYLLATGHFDSNDPMLLWQSTGTADYEDGFGTPQFNFPESSSATLQNIMIGYGCHGAADETEFLAAVDSDWAAYANTDLAELGDACFTVAGTTTFERNVAVDTILTFGGLDNFDWSFGGGGGEIFYPLPEGLSYEMLNEDETDTASSMRIFGTPTVAGTTNADVSLWDGYTMDSYILLPFTVVNEAVASHLALSAAVGELVAGKDVGYSADGLQVDATFTLTARSTPQVIAEGTVPVSGSISGVATIPVGLEAGWHTITLDSTDNTGAALTQVVYFEIGTAGQLVSFNYTGIPTAPAAELELATTGFAGSNGALGALALTLVGAVLFGAALRRRNTTARTA